MSNDPIREALRACLAAMDVARDTIQPITVAQMKLHGLNPNTATLLDEAAAKAIEALAAQPLAQGERELPELPQCFQHPQVFGIGWMLYTADQMRAFRAEGIEIVLATRAKAAVPQPLGEDTRDAERLRNLQAWIVCLAAGAAAIPEFETMRSWACALAPITGDVVPKTWEVGHG
jgi:hypothetical protein